MGRKRGLGNFMQAFFRGFYEPKDLRKKHKLLKNRNMVILIFPFSLVLVHGTAQQPGIGLTNRQNQKGHFVENALTAISYSSLPSGGGWILHGSHNTGRG